MHDDEVDTDPSLVRRLVAGQFPEWADLPVQPVPSGGTDNALYRLGERMVVRLPRHERTNGTLEQEHRWLPKLAPLLPLPVPAPLARGMPAEGYPWEWSIYEWLDGETAYVAPIADSVSLATDLAQFVTALQRIDAAGGPPPSIHNAFRGVPLATRDESTRASIAALGSTIDGEAATAVWEAALRAPEWRHRPSGSTETSTLATCWSRRAASAPSSTGAVSAWAIPPATWRSRGRCSPRTRATSSGQRSRSTTRPGLASRGWVLSQAVNALSYYTLETNPELVREGGAGWRRPLGLRLQR